MNNKNLTLSEFSIEGKFQGFISDITGKFKYLRLATDSGDIQIKIPKKLRLPLSLSLEPGEQIRVSGVSPKLKAYEVTKVGVCPTQNTLLQQQTLIEHNQLTNISSQVSQDRLSSEASVDKPKAKIILCQKSGCLKRGGKGLLLELQKILRDRNLQDRVIIEYSTGCLKCCKSAPNYILQIGNKEYKNIHPQAIASFLENQISKAQINGNPMGAGKPRKCDCI